LNSTQNNNNHPHAQPGISYSNPNNKNHELPIIYNPNHNINNHEFAQSDNNFDNNSLHAINQPIISNSNNNNNNQELTHFDNKFDNQDNKHSNVSHNSFISINPPNPIIQNP
jgi:hypothetical protein